MPGFIRRLFSKQQMDDHFGPGLWRGPRQSRQSDGLARTTDDPTRLEDSRFVLGSVDLADLPRRWSPQASSARVATVAVPLYIKKAQRLYLGAVGESK